MRFQCTASNVRIENLQIAQPIRPTLKVKMWSFILFVRTSQKVNKKKFSPFINHKKVELKTVWYDVAALMC